MRIAIIGAGMAGLACAEHLVAQGHEVRLLDKGRGPGGRMSTRRVRTADGVAEFDHGAQYFTVRDPSFRRRVEAWIAAGYVAAWPAAGSQAYVGLPGMSAPLRQMAEVLGVRFATEVTGLERHADGVQLTLASAGVIDADAAVLALPAEQAAGLLTLAAPDLADQASVISSEPCWTVLLAFAQPIAVAEPCWRGGDADVLAWAARNSSKPGRSGPESWVLQAGAEWSRRHLEADPGGVAQALQDALAQWLGIGLPPLLVAQSHRWRFARSGAAGLGSIWDRHRRLGICGDWLIGPRVEAAWLSGTALADRIGAAPPGY
jgi:predicted NAD/FAD-dependent oxidoreductase